VTVLGECLATILIFALTCALKKIMGKGSKLIRNAAKEIVTFYSGEESGKELMDLDEEEFISGSATGTQAGDSPEGFLGLHGRDSTADAEQSLSDTKRSRREQIAALSLEEAIRVSAEAERQSSIHEMGEFRGLIARLASENAKFKEELTSLKEKSSVKSAQANYGFLDNVLMLEVATDVTKPKVTAIIS
jgi:hypothetical protein